MGFRHSVASEIFFIMSKKLKEANVSTQIVCFLPFTALKTGKAQSYFDGFAGLIAKQKC